MQLKIQQLQEKIKMVSTPLSVKVGNASKAFTASILRGPNSLLNHLFKASSPFGDSEAAESPAPKAPVIESAITETAIGRAVSISTTVIPCSQNKVQILSVKDVSLSTITVFQSFLVVQPSSSLAYLYIASFVIQNKKNYPQPIFTFCYILLFIC